MTQTNDLDAKVQKMQALLERWLDRFGCLAGTNRQNQQLVDDTKQLLKEAKEVKHGDKN